MSISFDDVRSVALQTTVNPATGVVQIPVVRKKGLFSKPTLALEPLTSSNVRRFQEFSKLAEKHLPPPQNEIERALQREGYLRGSQFEDGPSS